VIPRCLPPREPTRPNTPPPPLACDTHAHVFGPAAQFPYADDRSYTPPDAPLEKYLRMLDTVGFARGVLVQGSAHGRDNAAMLDALARHPDRLRGVPMPIPRRQSCGAGTRPGCADCASTISSATARCTTVGESRSTRRKHWRR
jgi:Amidohydrolase